MDNVLTLIAGVDGPMLEERAIGRVRDALRGLGAMVGSPDWLREGIAVDLAFEEAPPDLADASARRALDGASVDVIAQHALGRRKKLLVADMDSTIITSETLDELADQAGLKERVAPITARAMNGEIDFAVALRERVALLAGLEEKALDVVWRGIRISPGAEALVATMRSHGATTALVSGGFRYFTTRVRAALGFDLDQANELLVADGRLTGVVEEPILDKHAKLAALRGLAGERNLPLSATLTVGDGANDLPMLLAAGLGVAYRAKPSVATTARARIDHADLTALLWAQGYRSGEIVAGEIAAGASLPATIA